MSQAKTPRERALEGIRLLVPDWQPTARQVLWTIRGAIVLGVLIVIGYAYGISLWDWAQLLIVPAVLAFGGYWFSHQQQNRELWIADQRDQEATLRAYIEQMGQMLLDKDRPLRASEEGDEVRTLARARTVTVLGRLDPSRKKQVVQFLGEAKLIALVWDKGPIIKLSGAHLSGTDLSGACLSRARLDKAKLNGANLSYADLSGAGLIGANLNNANLSHADLSYAHLGLGRGGSDDATLIHANLSYANLSAVGRMSWEVIARSYGVSLQGAHMPNGQENEDWIKDKEGHGEGEQNSGHS